MEYNRFFVVFWHKKIAMKNSSFTDFMRLPWRIHGNCVRFSMDFIWYSRGSSVDFPWLLHGTYAVLYFLGKAEFFCFPGKPWLFHGYFIVSKYHGKLLNNFHWYSLRFSHCCRYLFENNLAHCAQRYFYGCRCHLSATFRISEQQLIFAASKSQLWSKKVSEASFAF